MTEKHLIVGLGNPGAKYQQTRHNAGYWTIDELVARLGLGRGRGEQRAQTWQGMARGKRLILAKPQTFMNRSGESLRALLAYHDIPPEKLLVIYDDLDTPFGDLRLRQGGGHGGHNGMRSVLQHLGSRDFARLRFGIGRPPGKMNPVDYVLRPWKGDDAIRARELAGRAADAALVWLAAGIESAMTQFNGGAARPAATAVDLKAQLALAQRAHELAPAEPKPLAKLIALLKKLGNMREAADKHLALAHIYAERGQPRLALAERVKAVSIRPSLVEIQQEIADAYLAAGNKKKAVARRLILSDYYAAQGQRAHALETVEAALTINPQHPKALLMRQALLQESTE